MTELRSFRAEKSQKKIERSYHRWSQAILNSPIPNENGMRLRRNGLNVMLAPTGDDESSLSVQFPGTNANKRTAIGVGGQFGFLLCQSYKGGLGGGIRSPLDGLEQVHLRIEGPKNRKWHVVADLNQEPEDIALQTTRTALIWVGRHVAPLPQRKDGAEMLNTGPAEGAAEKRGVIVRTARDVQVFDKRHAEVWNYLKKEAEKRGLTCKKSKGNGFETDIVVCSKARSVLLEIKISAAKADIYCAIGQLTVYPRVIGGLGKCCRVLLVPEKPASALLPILKELGIVVVTYSPNTPIRFSAGLWNLFADASE